LKSGSGQSSTPLGPRTALAAPWTPADGLRGHSALPSAPGAVLRVSGHLSGNVTAMRTLECPICGHLRTVTADQPGVRCTVARYRDRSQRGILSASRQPVCSPCVTDARTRGRWEAESPDKRTVAHIPARPLTTTACEVCDIPVALPEESRRKSNVCGDRCRRRLYRSPVPKTVTVCHQCGTEFHAKSGARYCTPRCRQASYRRRSA
jgi:hypothetical protein